MKIASDALSSEFTRVELVRRLVLSGHVAIGEPEGIHDGVSEDVRLAGHHAIGYVVAVNDQVSYSLRRWTN